MRIVYNTIIPFRGFMAINLFGVLFVRKDYKGKVTPEVINHESIHTEQMREMLYIFFYLWYVLEWIVRLIVQPRYAYRSISFEQEAYMNQDNGNYLATRRRFAWLGYLTKPYKN